MSGPHFLYDSSTLDIDYHRAQDRSMGRETSKGANRVTILETWITETVANLVRDMRAENEPDWGDICARTEEQRNFCRQAFRDSWDEMERRAGVILVQARALECRHLAAELQINAAGNPAARQVAGQLLDRSSKLEAIGMMLARGPWPIPDKDAPKVQVVTH